jgi:hypothetical protein
MEILIGLVIGFAIGGTGVGGGTLAAPAFVLLLGYSPRIAVGTALVFAAAVKIFASAEYLFRRQVNFKILMYLLCGGLPGAFIGAMALERLKTERANQWILCGIGLVVMISAISSVVKFRNPETSGAAPRPRWLPFITFPIGLETGFSSAGAGALGTVVLFQLTSLAPSMVVGTDLVFGLLVSTVGGTVHALSGTCNWIALAKLIPSGIIGAMIGVRVCTALPRKTLRKSILICAAAIGFSLVVKGMEGIL